MKNYVQPGCNVTVTAPANTTSGDGLLMGQLFGIAAETVSTGDDLDLVTEGVFDLAKKTTHVFAVGDVVYWDADSKQAASAADADSNSAGANEALIGIAIEAAGAGATTVRTKLAPSPVTLV